MEQLKPELKPGEKIDRLGYRGLHIIQDQTKFKFTMDAFLLAGFINPKPDHQIIDLGSGGGVLSLLIAGQKQVQSVYGLEIQPELVDMSRRSVTLNQLENKISIVIGDIKDPPTSLKPNSFDYVVSNPPFFPMDKGVVSENLSLAMAKFEIGCMLEDVIKTSSRMVKGNGKVVFIFPTERLNELILTFNRYHLTPKKLCFVHPKPSEKSNLVLIEARPAGKNGIEITPPIMVYNENGEYTELMNSIFLGKILLS